MSSNSPGPSGSSNSSEFNALPRGLLGRKGVPIARGARLPSIRSPRDLTLGGTPKRTFTPNLNIKRDKNKDLNETTNSSPGKKDGQDGKRSQRNQGPERGRGGRGRGRGRGRGELIQTQGSVFGEGPAAAMIKKGIFGKSERESSNHIPVPKLHPIGINRTKEEKLQDEEKLQELLRDDFIDDLDNIDIKMQPVQLPLLKSDVIAELDDKMNVEELEQKEKVKVKTEPEAMEIDGEDGLKLKVKPEAPKMSQERKDPSASELFCDSSLTESGMLLLFQFPDSLPGIAASSDDAKPDPRKKASTSAAPPQPTADDGDYSVGRVLADFPEGYIGKLQVLKSGKTRLMLGSVTFNIESGTPFGFLQDLVSVKTKEESSSEIIVLGHVKHKLVCLPDMDILLAPKQMT